MCSLKDAFEEDKLWADWIVFYEIKKLNVSIEVLANGDGGLKARMLLATDDCEVS